MDIRYFVKLLVSLVISFYILAFSEPTFIDHNSNDSIFQKQDSSFQIIWENDNQNSSSTNLIVTGNQLFTSSDNGLIQCFLSDGQEKWAAEVLGSIKNNAVQFKDLFLTATYEGDLYSINSNNGDVVQVIGVGENITTDLLLIDLTNNNSKRKGVVFGTEIGNIFCYDIFSFEKIWETNLSSFSLISKPVVAGDKIIFNNLFSSLYCVNAKSGLLIWKYDFEQKESSDNYGLILTNGKTIFALTPKREILAIDLMLGKKSWSSSAIDVIPQIAISFDKQKIILLDKKGVLIFISPKDGKEIKKLDLNKSDLFSFFIAENEENTFVGFSDGSLYSLDLKYDVKQLISQTNIPITSINLIGKDGLIIKDINGKLTFYKTN